MTVDGEQVGNSEACQCDVCCRWNPSGEFTCAHCGVRLQGATSLFLGLIPPIAFGLIVGAALRVLSLIPSYESVALVGIFLAAAMAPLVADSFHPGTGRFRIRALVFFASSATYLLLFRMEVAVASTTVDGLLLNELLRLDLGEVWTHLSARESGAVRETADVLEANSAWLNRFFAYGLFLGAPVAWLASRVLSFLPPFLQINSLTEGAGSHRVRVTKRVLSHGVVFVGTVALLAYLLMLFFQYVCPVLAAGLFLALMAEVLWKTIFGGSILGVFAEGFGALFGATGSLAGGRAADVADGSKGPTSGAGWSRRGRKEGRSWDRDGNYRGNTGGDGRHWGKDGNFAGKTDADGRHWDRDGNYSGRTDSDGRQWDRDGNYSGKTDTEGRHWDKDGRFDGKND